MVTGNEIWGGVVRVTGALALVAVAFAVLAGSAIAAPSFGIELTRDAGSVSHSDKRVDYTVTVSNQAASGARGSVGDSLACVGAKPQKNWIPSTAPGFVEPYDFAFEWMRNGQTITGAESDIYGLTSEDAGKAIQCVVKGTNELVDAPGTKPSAVFASQPVVVVNPALAIEPPEPEVRTAAGSRPTVTGTVLSKRTCTPPANWLPKAPDPNAPTYSFRWLRNGVPIAGATTNEYTPVEAEDKDTVLQCEVVGTNAGGSTVGISNISAVAVSTPANRFPSSSPAQTPEVLTNSPAGTVTTEVSLPGGSETFAFEATGEGWSCDTAPPSGGQPAMVICTRTGASAILPPGNSYPALEIVTALGADAPDLAIARATVFGGGAAASASDEDSYVFGPAIPFGLTEFEARLRDAAGDDYVQAGGHPFDGRAHFVLAQSRSLIENVFSKNQPIEFVKQVITDIPRGVVGNALAPPALCPTLSDVEKNTCPSDSVVGEITATFAGMIFHHYAIFAIEPEVGTPAQFAFRDPTGAIYTLSARLRPDDGYGLSLELAPTPIIDLLEAEVTFCDFGGQSMLSGESIVVTRCNETSEPGANAIPLFTNPTRCGAPVPVTRARVDSWGQPGKFVEADPFVNAEITGCDQVEFTPTMKITPSSRQADSATGLEVDLKMPTDGLEDPTGLSQSNLRKTRIVFPAGMSINPSAGQGLASCSAAEVKLKTDDPDECPESAKVGTIEINTPILQEKLTGDVYIAKQGDVGGALIGLYLVFGDPRDGILIKLPARVDPDPVTGQLVATLDESVEAPIESVKLHFPQGPRSPLLNPPTCGTYEIKAQMSPWSAADPAHPSPAEIVTKTSSFTVDSGPDGSPCPDDRLRTTLSAGTIDPAAGKASPFVLRLSRDDGTQRVSGLTVQMPPGLTAYLTGIPYCPQATIDSIPAAAGSGEAQILDPSCPTASQIGTAIAGAGAGPDPLYVQTGRVYLGPPYKGAPISLVTVVPAVAGPIDLGNVVVQSPAYVNTETAQVTAVAEPLPTILHGILLDLRDLRIDLDRPHFMLNPTSCGPRSTGVDVKGMDGASQSLSSHFQVGGCGALPFKPKLKLQLKGATKRIGHPALRAVVTAKPGEANIGRAQVNLPHGEFLDQGNLNKTCTKPVLMTGNCPASSVYGRARVWTPLLDEPLEGNVYLVGGYGYKLPALVADLNGQIRILLVGKVDSGKNKGIRTTFELVPDAPVSRFELSMKGGRKYGLLENSENLCKASKADRRAVVRFTGQNNKVDHFKPVVSNQCRKHRRRHKEHEGHVKDKRLQGTGAHQKRGDDRG